MDGREFWSEIMRRMENCNDQWVFLFNDDGPAMIGEGIEDQETLNQFLMAFYSTPDSGVEIAERVIEVS